jgi:TM2 domain-containing membrane protein YozV
MGESKEKDLLLTLFLSIVFGWCGLDRLYRGQYIAAFLKAVTFGGFGIWWLIDIFLVLFPEADIFKDL